MPRHHSRESPEMGNRHQDFLKFKRWLQKAVKIENWKAKITVETGWRYKHSGPWKNTRPISLMARGLAAFFPHIYIAWKIDLYYYITYDIYLRKYLKEWWDIIFSIPSLMAWFSVIGTNERYLGRDDVKDGLFKLY